MICIDPRAGSKNLTKLFPHDMTVETELPAGDILLTSGDGNEFWVAVEHKKMDDVLSCIVTGRFAGTQLPALMELNKNTGADYWLLIEGFHKEGPNGELLVPSNHGQNRWRHAQVGTRQFDWDDLEKWKITMQTLTGLKIKQVESRSDTKDWVMLLLWWWENKDRHKSHMALDKSRESIELTRATLLRRVAEQLPGIGHDKALRVEAHFGDIFEMVVADQSEWLKIEGVGMKMADRIVEAIRGRE
jgi:ERCC4-type nuclease